MGALTTPLKVCHVCSSLPEGGLARVVLNLAEELSDTLSLSLIATAFPGHHWPHNDDNKWQRRAVIQKRSKLARYAALYRLLREWQPDVVHTHQEAYAPVIARLARIPVVIETIHTGPEWLTLGRHPVRALRRRCVSRHVAVSSGLAEELVSAGHLSAREVATVPNGVRIGRPVSLRRNAIAEPHIGTVGRLVPGKGISYLIQAFTMLSRDFPQARLTIVGDGELRPELEVELQRSGLIGRARILGYVDRPREVLREFDIFVLPSLWEGFGLSLAEAMAEGVPAIASDLPAIASFCRNGVDALLVPPGDAAAIYRALVTLLRDESLRFSLASSAYERVCQEFSIRVMAERYLDLYRELFDIVRGTPGCTPTRKR